jgi:biotin carboxyl carrier protein
VRLVVTVGAEPLPVEVIEAGPGTYRVGIGDVWVDVDARLPPSGPCSLLIGGVSYVADVLEAGAETLVVLDGAIHRVKVEEAGRKGRRGAGAGASLPGQRLVAPMPGKVVAVHVRAGDRVAAGAPLVVLEAMKMENEFRAAAGGVVTEVRVAPGAAVNAGDLLVVLD